MKMSITKRGERRTISGPTYGGALADGCGVCCAFASGAVAANSPGAATLRLRVLVVLGRGTEPAGSPSFLGRPTGRLTGGGALGSTYLVLSPLPFGRPGPRFTGALAAAVATPPASPPVAGTVVPTPMPMPTPPTPPTPMPGGSSGASVCCGASGGCCGWVLRVLVELCMGLLAMIALRSKRGRQVAYRARHASWPTAAPSSTATTAPRRKRTQGPNAAHQGRLLCRRRICCIIA